MNFDNDPVNILERLAELRRADAPTHGGRVLSYVYDSGLAELDELAASAIRAVQPVNGLDPTTFTSVAVMEREVLGFARDLLGGDEDVVGTVTTGGTESCLLAVKTARDVWRGSGLPARTGTPRLLAPVTVHAAFQKAAHYFGLELDLVPVGPGGEVAASDLIARMGDDVALVVVSAPSYAHAAMDPVVEVAAAASERGIACHVDACIGGWVLPFWEGVEPWNFEVTGVTSISADLHKFGYSPKGASVILQRGRDRQRTQYFATTQWPGYPIVNPTILGSKSAGPLAAAWAIIQALGTRGLAELSQSCERSTRTLRDVIGGIEGLRVVGNPVGPLLAVAMDESVAPERRVDPHHWADQTREHGFLLQLQPSLVQSDGSVLPATTHLTVTPVTADVIDELTVALTAAAAEVRGIAPIAAEALLATLPAEALAALGSPDVALLDSETAATLLGSLGIGAGAQGLPDRMAPLLALIAAMPAPLTERLLIELLARLIEPEA